MQALDQIVIRAGHVDVADGDGGYLHAGAVGVEAGIAPRQAQPRKPPADGLVPKKRRMGIAPRQQPAGKLKQLVGRVGRPAEANARVGKPRVMDGLQRQVSQLTRNVVAPLVTPADHIADGQAARGVFVQQEAETIEILQSLGPGQLAGFQVPLVVGPQIPVGPAKLKEKHLVARAHTESDEMGRLTSLGEALGRLARHLPASLGDSAQLFGAPGTLAQSGLLLSQVGIFVGKLYDTL